MKVRPGKPYPLGATWDGMGVNFNPAKVVLDPHAKGIGRTATCRTSAPGSSTATGSMVLTTR